LRRAGRGGGGGGGGGLLAVEGGLEVHLGARVVRVRVELHPLYLLGGLGEGEEGDEALEVDAVASLEVARVEGAVGVHHLHLQLLGSKRRHCSVASSAAVPAPAQQPLASPHVQQVVERLHNEAHCFGRGLDGRAAARLHLPCLEHLHHHVLRAVEPQPQLCLVRKLLRGFLLEALVDVAVAHACDPSAAAGERLVQRRELVQVDQHRLVLCKHVADTHHRRGHCRRRHRPVVVEAQCVSVCRTVSLVILLPLIPVRCVFPCPT